MPIDLALLSPGEHGAGGELRSVVGHDEAGFSTTLDQIRQLARHAPIRNRGVRDCRQALARHVVDDVQDTKPPAAGELIVDEVERPARVGAGFDKDRRPRADGASPRPPLAHCEAFLAIEPIDAIDPGRLALLPQQDEQPPVAKAPALVG